MKRLLLILAIGFASFQAACGGGGGNPTPPPPTGNFSNADLNGQYAFTMVGQNADPNNSGFFARVGVFVADGHGNITSGIEDVNTAAGEDTLLFTSSTYSINPDGRGTVNLTNESGTLTFSVTLISPSQGLIVQTDLNSTTSGTFNLQNTNSFTAASLSNNYVFDFAGISPDENSNFLPDSIVGQMTLNNGVVQTGVTDENFAAQPSGPLTITNGALTFDPTNGPTFGRGILDFTADGTQFSYVFYVVDGNRLHLMETESSSLTVGDAIKQTAPPTTNANFTGSYAYLLGGSSGSGIDIRVGRFTSDGNGGLTGIAQDENNLGDIFAVPNGTLSATTYSVDQDFPGSGRVTVTFSDSKLSKNGPYTFIAYMASGSQGVFQDISNGFVLDGQILAQTGGPFTTTNLAGDYAFNYSGLGFNNDTSASGEEDFVGHLKLTDTSTNNATGVMDFSAFSSNQGVFLDIGITGTLTIGGDGTTSSGTRNTLPLKTNSTPAVTYPFIAYPVNSGTTFILSTHVDHIDAGTMIKQSK